MRKPKRCDNQPKFNLGQQEKKFLLRPSLLPTQAHLKAKSDLEEPTWSSTVLLFQQFLTKARNGCYATYYFVLGQPSCLLGLRLVYWDFCGFSTPCPVSQEPPQCEQTRMVGHPALFAGYKFNQLPCYLLLPDFQDPARRLSEETAPFLWLPPPVAGIGTPQQHKQQPVTQTCRERSLYLRTEN